MYPGFYPGGPGENALAARHGEHARKSAGRSYTAALDG